MAAATTRCSTHVRPIELADVDHAARIAFEAFAGIADRHGFPRDFPSVDAARALVDAFTRHPSIWGLVAERDGRIVGSNFLDERGPVRGVGPITVDSAEQGGGVGRVLMEAALERAAGARSVRLLQDSFNTASLALYASLGFEVAEQVVLVVGTPSFTCDDESLVVRPLDAGDIDACEQLCVAVHGFDRTAELRDALEASDLEPVVAHRGGRLVAYATTFADFGAAHAVAETEDDLFELLAGGLVPGGPTASFLLPLNQAALVRRVLRAGLRVVKPMTYMVTGSYHRPQGAWIPSVLY
jgi:predicted N-acetyltransferase YhbS